MHGEDLLRFVSFYIPLAGDSRIFLSEGGASDEDGGILLDWL